MSGNEESIRWRKRGRDANPRGAFVVLVAAVGAGLFGYLLLRTTGLFLGPAVVLLSTADFLFGRSFELNDKEARSWIGPNLTAISWTDVSRVVADGPRILLLPAGAVGWRSAFRGVALEPLDDNRQEVERAVRERIPTSAAYEA